MAKQPMETRPPLPLQFLFMQLRHPILTPQSKAYHRREVDGHQGVARQKEVMQPHHLSEVREDVAKPGDQPAEREDCPHFSSVQTREPTLALNGPQPGNLPASGCKAQPGQGSSPPSRTGHRTHPTRQHPKWLPTHSPMHSEGISLDSEQHFGHSELGPSYTLVAGWGFQGCRDFLHRRSIDHLHQ